MSKILVLANHYNSLIVFRKDLLIKLVKDGHDVTVTFPKPDDEKALSTIESYGVKIKFIEMERRGMNPLKDLKLLSAYKKLIKEEQPDKVLAFTIKCNIYGARASRKYKTPCYAFVTGLGSMFNTGKLKKFLAVTLYKWGVKKVEKIFFENEGNRQVFLDSKIIDKERTVVTNGAGVNLTDFAFEPYKADDGVTEFLFISRIMKEKGVEELFFAIDKLKAEYGENVKFSFLGGFEENYKDKVESLSADGKINYYGFQKDVKPYITNASAVILPSYHEGMSNALLESAALGRPIIASDIFGCKEAIIDGQNGFLVKVRDKDSLYDGLKKFIETPYEKKVKMGETSRKHMEDVFDKQKVVEKTLNEIY